MSHLYGVHFELITTLHSSSTRPFFPPATTDKHEFHISCMITYETVFFSSFYCAGSILKSLQCIPLNLLCTSFSASSESSPILQPSQSNAPRCNGYTITIPTICITRCRKLPKMPESRRSSEGLKGLIISVVAGQIDMEKMWRKRRTASPIELCLRRSREKCALLGLRYHHERLLTICRKNVELIAHLPLKPFSFIPPAFHCQVQPADFEIVTQIQHETGCRRREVLWTLFLDS